MCSSKDYNIWGCFRGRGGGTDVRILVSLHENNLRRKGVNLADPAQSAKTRIQGQGVGITYTVGGDFGADFIPVEGPAL